MSIQRINELIEKIQSEDPDSLACLIPFYKLLYGKPSPAPTNSTEDNAPHAGAVGDLFDDSNP